LPQLPEVALPQGPVAAALLPCWRELQAQAAKSCTVVVSPVDADLLMGGIALCPPGRHPPERAELCNQVATGVIVALKAVR
jgi:hypothetical protein